MTTLLAQCRRLPMTRVTQVLFLALLIMLVTIVCAATEWVDPPLAFLMGAVAMVVTRCVGINQAYREIDVRIFVMIAGVIPLGIAMEQTGTADLLLCASS